MTTSLDNAPEEDQMALLNSFPEHGDQPEGEALDCQRAAYRQRFGCPFIIVLKGRCEKSSVEAALAHRLQAFEETEREKALAEVIKLVERKLAPVMGWRTGGTHAE